MTVYATEGINSRDVLKWAVHPAFCYEEDSVDVGNTVALERGESLAGRAVSGAAGSRVLIDTGDTVTPGTTNVAVIISDKHVVSDLATGAAIGKLLLLTQGPAIISSDGLTAGGLALTNVIAALALKNIKVVSSLGDLAVVPNEI